MNKLISFLLARAGWIFAAVLALCALLAFFAKDIAIEAKSTSFFLADDPDLKAFFKTEETFGSQDFLLYALSFKDSAFSPDALDLTRRAREIIQSAAPHIKTMSILNAPLFFSGAASIDAGADIARASEEILSNPIYAKNLISPDSSTISLLISAGSASELEAVLPQLDALTAANPLLRTSVLGGMSVIVDHMIAYIKSDLATYGSALVVLLSIAVWAFFGSFYYVFCCLLICVASLLSSLGFFALSGYAITVISSNYVPLVLIITISVIIHILAHFNELACARKSERKLLVRHTLLAKSKPSFFAILTTVVGFLSLVFSGIVPISELGVMMSIGIVFSLILAYLLMPFLLLKAPAGRPARLGARTLSFAAHCAINHRGKIYLLSAAALVLCALAIPRLHAENSFANYFKDSSVIKRGLVLIDEKLGGTLPLDVILRWEDGAAANSSAGAANSQASGETAVAANSSEQPTNPQASGEATNSSAGAANPQASGEAADVAATDDNLDDFDDFLSEISANEFFITKSKLDELARVHEFLERTPHVGSVLSMASLAKFAERLAPGAADTMGLNLALKSLDEPSKRQIVYPYYNEGQKLLRLAVRMKDSDRDLRRAELIATLKRELPKLTHASVEVSGVMVLYNNMLSSLVHSQVDTLAFVIASIFVLFLLIFRNLRFSVIGIIANVVPLSALFSIIAFAGLKLDLMSITIAAISIGIGVDDIIHYVHRFREEIKHRSLPEAIRATHASVGSALFYTTTTVVLGFMLMISSSFTPTIYFGLLTVLVMILLLCGSLFLLPALVISWHGRGYFKAEFKEFNARF